jgi:hypothetical protein
MADHMKTEWNNGETERGGSRDKRVDMSESKVCFISFSLFLISDCEFFHFAWLFIDRSVHMLHILASFHLSTGFERLLRSWSGKMCQFAELHSILAAPPDTMEIYDGKRSE